MKQLDLDRAFPATPDCIETAIELGLRKGKKKMKFRNKLIAAGSIAAMFAVVIAAALAMIPERSETPDVLAQPPLTVAAEEITVYFMPGSEYYHADHCKFLMQSRMQEVSEQEAVLLGLKPCEVCIPQSCPGHADAIEFIYYSQGGKYFHRQQECSGGVMPLKGEYAAVLEEYPGKEPCPICFPEGIELCLHGKAIAVVSTPVLVSELVTAENPAESADASTPEESVPAAKKSGGDAVYTEYGANLTTYHRLKGCAGREFPREISILQANREHLQPCEACYFGYVCYNNTGTYYHSDANCQDMRNARQHSRQDARSDGKFPCPLCLNVYSTEGGVYFHMLPDCMGMMDAELRTLEEASALGQTRCPVCLSPETVYCTTKGNYFHAEQYCSGMQGASPTDPESAWAADKDPCPVCITGKIATLLSRSGDSEPADAEQSLFLLHEQLFQSAFGFLPEAKAKGYHFVEFSSEPYCWHLTDGESYPLNSALYTPGGDYDGYRIHLYSGAQPTVMRQIMEQVAATPVMDMYSMGIQCLKQHIIHQGHSFSESKIDIQSILVQFDDAQRICGASIDFFYDQSIVSVAFTPESEDYRSWNAELTTNPL